MCRLLYVVLPNVKRSEKIRTARMANAIRASRSSCSMARDFHVHSSPDAFPMLVLFLPRSCARDLSLNTRLSFPSPRDSVHLLAAFSTCLAHLRQDIFPRGDGGETRAALRKSCLTSRTLDLRGARLAVECSFAIHCRQHRYTRPRRHTR